VSATVKTLSLESSADLVDWVTALDSESLPPSTVDAVETTALHYLYCALRGASTSVGRVASVMLSGGAVPRDAAREALVNGIVSHATLQEDMHVPSQTHIGVVVWSCLLALAGENDIPSSRLVAGAVAGYEVMGVVGETLARCGVASKFRPTAILGPLGAWAAAASALQLTRKETASALAFAANAAAGLNGWAWQGGEEVYLHAGQAAQAGILAVRLARAGLRGSADPLFAPAGYFDSFVSRRAPTDATRPRRRFVVEEVVFKRHPGCNYVQTVVDVCEALAPSLRHHGPPARVEVAVTRAARDYPGCDNPGPWHRRLEAQMSIQFAAAATLGTGDYAGSLDLPSREWRDAFATTAANTVVEASQELDAAYPAAQGAVVRLVLADGSTSQAMHADMRSLSHEEVRANLDALVRERANAERAALPLRLDASDPPFSFAARSLLLDAVTG